MAPEHPGIDVSAIYAAIGLILTFFNPHNRWEFEIWMSTKLMASNDKVLLR